MARISSFYDSYSMNHTVRVQKIKIDPIAAFWTRSPLPFIQFRLDINAKGTRIYTRVPLSFKVGIENFLKIMSRLSKDNKTQWFLLFFWSGKVVISITTYSKQKSTDSYGNSDVGDLKLMAICGCWWLNFHVGDIFWMLMKKIVNVVDQMAETIF